MKIAIVRGGFDGIVAQKKRWDLERTVEALEISIENQEKNLNARRVRLATLKAKLARTPTQEIKQ